jgi:hypothetical protein
MYAYYLLLSLPKTAMRCEGRREGKGREGKGREGKEKEEKKEVGNS